MSKNCLSDVYPSPASFDCSEDEEEEDEEGEDDNQMDDEISDGNGDEEEEEEGSRHRHRSALSYRKLREYRIQETRCISGNFVLFCFDSSWVWLCFLFSQTLFSGVHCKTVCS